MVKEFLTYAIPSAFSMLISALYTIIDGMFVGQGVGDSALAAINIVLPFTVMLVGIANMMAVGGGVLVSKNFGEGNVEKAVNIFRQVMKFLMIVTVIISIITVVFTKQIVILLGSTPQLETLAVDYLRYYALFCIPNLAGMALSSFARNDKQPRLAMVATIAGAIANIILDYLFIFEFNMGIKGAAVATGLGQILTVIILLPHFLKKKGLLSFGKVKLEKEIIKELLNIGLPSFFGQLSYSVIVLIHNVAITRYIGEMGVSSYSIINYIGTNIYMILFGLTLGAQPLISYNFGKKDTKKMLGFYKINCIASVITTFVCVVICYVFGPNIISIFTQDPQIADMAYKAVKFSSVSYFMVGLNLNTIVYYQAIEIPNISTLICFLRSVVALPLGFMILMGIMGVDGIWAGVIFSETITFIVINIIANIKKKTNRVLEEDLELSFN